MVKKDGKMGKKPLPPVCIPICVLKWCSEKFTHRAGKMCYGSLPLLYHEMNHGICNLYLEAHFMVECELPAWQLILEFFIYSFVSFEFVHEERRQL